MNRRALVVTAGTLLPTLVGGCLGDDLRSGRNSNDGNDESAGGGNATDEPTEIRDVAFDTGVSLDETVDVSDGPTISIEENEIRVEGRYSIGNACYDAHLNPPVYDAENDTLRIRPSRSHDGSDECEDLGQELTYRVGVVVDGSLPGIIEVNENMGGETSLETE